MALTQAAMAQQREERMKSRWIGGAGGVLYCAPRSESVLSLFDGSGGGSSSNGGGAAATQPHGCVRSTIFEHQQLVDTDMPCLYHIIPREVQAHHPRGVLVQRVRRTSNGPLLEAMNPGCLAYLRAAQLERAVITRRIKGLVL